MFERSAQFYDAIYAWKNYEQEAGRLIEFIDMHKKSGGSTLLDVACGTGAHMPFLQEHFAIEGLDINGDLLDVARARCPAVRFHQGDMCTTRLDRQFDIVACLFSSIGYVKTAERLWQAIANMAAHVAPGGVLLIEPWFSPQTWKGDGQAPTVHFVDEPELKVTRMLAYKQSETVVSSDFHYLVATRSGVEHFTEHHEMGLFTDDEYLEGFRAAGLSVVHDKEGLMGRGLFIGSHSPCDREQT